MTTIRGSRRVGVSAHSSSAGHTSQLITPPSPPRPLSERRDVWDVPVDAVYLHVSMIFGVVLFVEKTSFRFLGTGDQARTSQENLLLLGWSPGTEPGETAAAGLSTQTLFRFLGTKPEDTLQLLFLGGQPVVCVPYTVPGICMFHCMSAGRHSDSTPDSRRVRLYSRLPCGSYGAGSPTADRCSS